MSTWFGAGVEVKMFTKQGFVEKGILKLYSRTVILKNTRKSRAIWAKRKLVFPHAFVINPQ